MMIRTITLFRSKSATFQLLSTLAVVSWLISAIYVFEGQVASAVPEAIIAQTNAALDAFFNSHYDYLDASILANFLQLPVDQTKTVMGNKILAGPVGKALLTQQLLDARVTALSSLEELRYFTDQAYSYEDAETLADFWGENSPYEAKLRIERNLIFDQQEAIDLALAVANS